MTNPRSWVAWISDAIVFIAAGIALCVSLIDLFDVWAVLADKRYWQVTLLIVSALALRERLGSIELLREVRRSTLRMVGPSACYESRDTLPPFTATARQTKSSITLVGVELGFIVLQQLSTLEELAVDGKRIRLLFVDPKRGGSEGDLFKDFEYTFGYKVRNEIEANLAIAMRWRDGLPGRARRIVEIGLTRALPTHIVVMIDENRAYGRVYVEMLPPFVDRQERWSALLTARDDRDLFTRYVSAYTHMWNEAEKIKVSSHRLSK